MIDPAVEMIQVANRYGAKLTFFVDVCMLWAFREAYAQELFEEGYRPDLELESHLIELVKDGHDIQLHMHPQWLRWSYEGSGQWNLDVRLWRLPEAIKSNVVHSVEDLFRKGKDTLEFMLQPHKKDYKCEVFRAGAWSIQPEKEILDGMKAAGFKIDSTVAHGMSRKDELTYYDFKNTPDNKVYGLGDSLDKEVEEGGLQEWPISTVPVGLLRKVMDKMRKSRNGILSSAPHCTGASHSGNSKSKWERLISQRWQMLSLDGTDAAEMIRVSKKAISRAPGKENVQLVMIGHSKNFGNPKELDAYLKWCSENKIEAVTW